MAGLRAYVSPGWFPRRPAAPTYLHVTVHVRGDARLLVVVPTSLVKISTTDGPQLVLGRESSGGKRGWQTEGLEQLRIHERHDLLDQVTTQGKNADAVARERAGLLVPHVRRERRLGIC